MMTGWADHLMIVPIVVPLVAAMVMLLIDERHRTIQASIRIAATFAVLVISTLLLRQADANDAGADIVAVYQLGNWPAPFGIVLVADRLAALMLVLTSLLGLAALAFSLARWQRAGHASTRCSSSC